MILIDKLVQKLKLQKKTIITKPIFLTGKKIRKIQMIFDLENVFESQNLSLFDKAAMLCKSGRTVNFVRNFEGTGHQRI